MRATKLLLSLALVLTALTLAPLLRDGGAARRGRRPAPCTLAPARHPARAIAERFALNPGQALIFSFEHLREVELDAPVYGRNVGQTIDLHRAAHGKMAMRIHGESPAGWRVGLEIESIESEDTSRVGGHLESGGLAGRMAGEVLAEIERCGRIGKLRFPPTMPAEGRRMWRDLLTCWQFESRRAPAYETLEKDVTGTCRVRYERLDDGLVRTPLEYVTIKGPRDARAEVSGETRYQFDPLPYCIEGQGVLTVDLGEAGGTVKSKWSFWFERTGVRACAERAAPQDSRRLTTLAETDGFDEDRDPAAARRQLQDRLHTLALERETALSELNELVTLLRGAPEGARDVLDVLRRTTQPKQAAFLSAALGAAGTEPAQRALLEVLTRNDGWHVGHRFFALQGVFQIPDPIVELDGALAALHAAAGEAAPTALLALGAVGYKQHGRDDERAKKIGETIVEALGDRPDPSALAAIGNLGPRQMPAAVRNAMDHEDPAVRAAALEATRRMPDAAVEPELVRRLREDESPIVRRAALITLAERGRERLVADGLDLTRVLREVAESDRDEGIRRLAETLVRQVLA
ncbi:MAG: HEAT repeat domain-containing protein [Planctomycetota bacterium]|jgi:HEAT repeat protein